MDIGSLEEQNFNSALDWHLQECTPEIGDCPNCPNEQCEHYEGFEDEDE